jgi:acyl carrier protein
MTDAESAIIAFIDELRQPATEPVLASDTRLMELGILDSMGLVRLIQFLEERFGVSVADADVTPELFASPYELATYVARHAAKQPA